MRSPGRFQGHLMAKLAENTTQPRARISIPQEEQDLFPSLEGNRLHRLFIEFSSSRESLNEKTKLPYDAPW